MGEWFQNLVDIEVRGADAEPTAARVLTWLIDNRYLEAEKSDCVLGAEGGYAPGPRSAEAVIGGPAVPLSVNGVIICTGRAVYHTWGDGMELRCPRCGASVEDEPARWDAVGDVIGSWMAGGDSVACCVLCGGLFDLNEWDWGSNPWAFGELGLTFCNWPPLAPEFVDTVSGIMNHRVVYNHGKF